MIPVTIHRDIASTKHPSGVDERVAFEVLHHLECLALPEVLALDDLPVQLDYVDAERPGRLPQYEDAPLGHGHCTEMGKLTENFISFDGSRSFCRILIKIGIYTQYNL